MRLKEIYFAFLTLAFQMMFHSIILTWVSLTGGDQGLMGGIPRPVFWGIDLSGPGSFYAFCMVVFVICALILRQIVQSPFGHTLRMIRDNPERAVFLGVNTYWAKLLAFVLAGFPMSLEFAELRGFNFAGGTVVSIARRTSDSAMTCACAPLK